MACSGIKNFFVHMFSCCGGEPEPPRRQLQIGNPTDFRREDVYLPGLTAEEQQFIREKARADASRLQNSIPIRPPPVPPPKPTYQPPQTEASENQYPRRSFRDRFNPFGDSQRHYQHERDDRLTESTTSSKSGSDSFELQHMKRNGMNHSHDSLTLHGSPIDPEKMYPKMF